MRNRPPWSEFDAVYCLTLEGDVDRQRHASAELCAIGLAGFVFIEGVKAESDEVREAYATGLVQAFLPCFRCGQATCGRHRHGKVASPGSHIIFRARRKLGSHLYTGVPAAGASL